MQIILIKFSKKSKVLSFHCSQEQDCIFELFCVWIYICRVMHYYYINGTAQNNNCACKQCSMISAVVFFPNVIFARGSMWLFRYENKHGLIGASISNSQMGQE